MKRSRRGNDREVKVIQRLESEGWLCGSRRHIGGAGDVLAIFAFARKYGVPLLGKAMLIEVKSTADGPYKNFGPADREALLEAAEAAGAEPFLAWWPPRRQLKLIPSSEWPA